MTCTAATASIPAHAFHAATASSATAAATAGPADMFAALLQEASGEFSAAPAPPPPVSTPAPAPKQAAPVPAKQPTAAEVPAPAPEVPPAQPVKAPEVAVAEVPVHGKGKAVAPQDSKQQAKPEQQLLTITVPAAVAPPPPPPLPFFRKREQTTSDGGSSNSAASAPKAPDSEPAPQVIHTDIALQVRLKTAEQPKSATTAEPATPAKPETDARPKAQPAGTDDSSTSGDAQSETPRHSAAAIANTSNAVPGSSDHPQLQQPSSPAPAAPPIHAPAAQPSVTVETPRPAPATPVLAQPPAPPVSTTAHLQEPVPEQKAVAQPLRSVSLEFTPDGASDVKLRLSERAGEVHISVHSSDTTLSGRLHEGVHDLVGSLSSAGYEAEAWTSNQGRQGQQRPPDEEEKTKRNTPQSGNDEFAGLFRQSSQENS